jgi:hypothetical protein
MQVKALTLYTECPISSMTMTAQETLYLSIGRNIKEAEQSQMFGKPCFKIHGKAFICFFQDEMVFKLNGAPHREALGLEGAQLFDPSGKKRPMKEWVQVHSAQWQKLAQAALNYADPS